MEKDKQADDNLGRLDQAAKALGEHFDYVQIIAVVYDRDGSRSSEIFNAGHGDIYSRIGATREWLIMREEETRESMRRTDDDD